MIMRDFFFFFSFCVFLVISGGELLVGGGANEDELIDDGGDAGADEWAEPVDPLVGPCPADDGGAEGHGGVHGGTVEGAAGEDVGANDEADGDGGDDADVALLGVHCGGVHRVDQPKGHHYLEHHRVPNSHAARQRKSRSFLRIFIIYNSRLI